MACCRCMALLPLLLLLQVLCVLQAALLQGMDTSPTGPECADRCPFQVRTLRQTREGRTIGESAHTSPC